MREIKFRAWDEIEKVMCPVKVINFEKGAFLLGNSPTPMQWLDDRSYIDEVEEGHFVDFENLELMQYTGMKDVNENEIYEGDVMFNDDRHEHGTVVWSKEKAMFVTEYGHDSYPLWQTVGNLYTVEGNIFENADLITRDSAAQP
jgi:uncharacterized phage protein (TIGR01671 family)